MDGSLLLMVNGWLLFTTLMDGLLSIEVDGLLSVKVDGLLFSITLVDGLLSAEVDGLLSVKVDGLLSFEVVDYWLSMVLDSDVSPMARLVQVDYWFILLTFQ